jgi:hypothetical protein
LIVKDKMDGTPTAEVSEFISSDQREGGLHGGGAKVEGDYGTDLYVGVEHPDGDGLARALAIPQQYRILDGIGCQLAAGVTGVRAQCRCYPIRIWHL